jgi:small subunit ribosomal protein S9
MADEPTPIDEQTPEEQPQEAAEAVAEQPAAEAPAEAEAAAEAAEPEAAPAEPVAEAEAPAEEPEAPAEEPVAEAEAPTAEAEESDDDEEPAAPRVKPEIPGAHLEVDIVVEGQGDDADPYAEDGAEGDASADGLDEVIEEPIAAVTINLAADARYSATGKRKRAVARVILKPGTGDFVINGKSLEDFFPRDTLQRTIRQPLETVGYETKMDVIARMHGGGVSAQADALRHGISRALLEADPNLRGELKRRGFLTRDARAKERKKAGLKKARKRPQFSKR